MHIPPLPPPALVLREQSGAFGTLAVEIPDYFLDDF